MDLGVNFWNLGWHKPNDCFQDFKNVSGDHPWNPQFLKEISIYRSLRFMDWDNTNGSQRENWSQRPRKADAKQNPVAYEWMIDLCNRNNADLWLTVPHRTITRALTNEPSDYALRLCILVKTGVDMGETNLKPMWWLAGGGVMTFAEGKGAANLRALRDFTAEDFIKAGGVKVCEPLKPNLKLYLEYSNETWNGAFKQSHYCCDEGEALGLDKNRWTAGFRYHAWAAIRLFRAADLVFGADNPRVIKVLATQSANSWIAGQHLAMMRDPRHNPWGVKASAIATAPYFGHKVDGADPKAAERLREAIQKSGQDSAKQKKIAEEAGLKLIAYEGGQHVTKNAKEINTSPLMHDLTKEYLDEMSKYFARFCYYAHVGRAGNGGAWGALEFTGQPLSEAHKYRALVEYAKENPAK